MSMVTMRAMLERTRDAPSRTRKFCLLFPILKEQPAHNVRAPTSAAVRHGLVLRGARHERQWLLDRILIDDMSRRYRFRNSCVSLAQRGADFLQERVRNVRFGPEKCTHTTHVCDGGHAAVGISNASESRKYVHLRARSENGEGTETRKERDDMRSTTRPTYRNASSSSSLQNVIPVSLHTALPSATISYVFRACCCPCRPCAEDMRLRSRAGAPPPPLSLLTQFHQRLS